MPAGLNPRCSYEKLIHVKRVGVTIERASRVQIASIESQLMPKLQTANFSLLRPAKVAVLVMVFSMCGLANLARADDIRTLGNIGDANKAVRLITKYTINTDTRSLDLIAATPSVSSLSKEQERQIAADTARQICAEAAVSGSWTVRIFMPGDSAPAGSCRTGGHH
jgi:hypothetical protein